MKPTDFDYLGHKVELKRYEMAYVSTRQDGYGNAKNGVTRRAQMEGIRRRSGSLYQPDRYRQG